MKLEIPTGVTREQRYEQLVRLSRSKNGLLQLQAIRLRVCGPIGVRNNDSLERLIKEILNAEFTQPCP